MDRVNITHRKYTIFTHYQGAVEVEHSLQGVAERFWLSAASLWNAVGNGA